VDSISPEELALWCQQTLPDNTRAFEALVARYKNKVFTTAYRLMGNREDAEDQAQNVFLKIFRNIKKLDQPVTLEAWIHRITINTCLDALEKTRRQPPTASISHFDSEEDAPQDFADKNSLDARQIAENKELLDCLQKALSKLDSSGRSALVLRDIEDRSYEEIAEALKIGLSAVKMRIHRARLSVQKLIEQICPGRWRAESV
jgi:RNA polymerase sigma-70 factor, ECF subfamily